MTTGKPVYRVFDSFQHWVNKARTWVNAGDVCIDANGDICRIGKDFMAAKYPVTVKKRID